LSLATADYEKVNQCTYQKLPVTYDEAEWLDANLNYWGKLGFWNTNTYNTLKTCPYILSEF